MRHCATCSAEEPDFANFCGHCGNALSPQAARIAQRNEQVAPPAGAAVRVEKHAVPEIIEPGKARAAAVAEADVADEVEADIAAAGIEPNLKLARLALGLACVPIGVNVIGLVLAGYVLRRVKDDAAAQAKARRTAQIAAAIAAAGLVVLLLLLMGSTLRSTKLPAAARGALEAPRVSEGAGGIARVTTGTQFNQSSS